MLQDYTWDMLITLQRKTPYLYFVKLLEALETLGIDRRDFLSAANVDLAGINSQGRYIELEHYLCAVQAALDLSQRKDLGFRVGSLPGAVKQSPLGYALFSNATLRESLARYRRHQYSLGTGLTLDIVVDGDFARFSAGPTRGQLSLSSAQLEYLTQSWLIGWNQLMPLLGEDGGFFDHICLGFTPACNPEIYANKLNCSVTHGCASTIAWFPADYLAKKITFSNKTGAAICAADSDQLGLKPVTETGLTGRIQRALLRSPGRMPSMQYMAECLHVSARTLRRKLLKENTTYKQLVIDFRIEMARHYLQETSLAANEIAALVAYSDTANFYRTFRSETGLTPMEFRHSQIQCVS